MDLLDIRWSGRKLLLRCRDRRSGSGCGHDGACFIFDPSAPGASPPAGVDLVWNDIALCRENNEFQIDVVGTELRVCSETDHRRVLAGRKFPSIHRPEDLGNPIRRSKRNS